MKEPKPREIYIHFKGEDKLYEVIVISRDADNPERKLVVYKSLYDTSKYPRGTIFSRSLEDFVGFKETNGKKIKRFSKVEGGIT